eukprot:jgi/Bigna1/70145/fgenesh1_pg.11_\
MEQRQGSKFPGLKHTWKQIPGGYIQVDLFGLNNVPKQNLPKLFGLFSSKPNVFDVNPNFYLTAPGTKTFYVPKARFKNIADSAKNMVKFVIGSRVRASPRLGLGLSRTRFLKRKKKEAQFRGFKYCIREVYGNHLRLDIGGLGNMSVKDRQNVINFYQTQHAYNSNFIPPTPPGQQQQRPQQQQKPKRPVQQQDPMTYSLMQYTNHEIARRIMASCKDIEAKTETKFTTKMWNGKQQIKISGRASKCSIAVQMAKKIADERIIDFMMTCNKEKADEIMEAKKDIEAAGGTFCTIKREPYHGQSKITIIGPMSWARKAYEIAKKIFDKVPEPIQENFFWVKNQVARRVMAKAKEIETACGKPGKDIRIVCNIDNPERKKITVSARVSILQKATNLVKNIVDEKINSIMLFVNNEKAAEMMQLKEQIENLFCQIFCQDFQSKQPQKPNHEGPSKKITLIGPVSTIEQAHAMLKDIFNRVKENVESNYFWVFNDVARRIMANARDIEEEIGKPGEDIKICCNDANTPDQKKITVNAKASLLQKATDLVKKIVDEKTDHCDFFVDDNKANSMMTLEPEIENLFCKITCEEWKSQASQTPNNTTMPTRIIVLTGPISCLEVAKDIVMEIYDPQHKAKSRHLPKRRKVNDPEPDTQAKAYTGSTPFFRIQLLKSKPDTVYVLDAGSNIVNGEYKLDGDIWVNKLIDGYVHIITLDDNGWTLSSVVTLNRSRPKTTILYSDGPAVRERRKFEPHKNFGWKGQNPCPRFVAGSVKFHITDAGNKEICGRYTIESKKYNKAVRLVRNDAEDAKMMYVIQREKNHYEHEIIGKKFLWYIVVMDKSTSPAKVVKTLYYSPNDGALPPSRGWSLISESMGGTLQGGKLPLPTFTNYDHLVVQFSSGKCNGNYLLGSPVNNHNAYYAKVDGVEHKLFRTMEKDGLYWKIHRQNKLWYVAKCEKGTNGEFPPASGWRFLPNNAQLDKKMLITNVEALLFAQHAAGSTKDMMKSALTGESLFVIGAGSAGINGFYNVSKVDGKIKIVNGKRTYERYRLVNGKVEKIEVGPAAQYWGILGFGGRQKLSLYYVNSIAIKIAMDNFGDYDAFKKLDPQLPPWTLWSTQKDGLNQPPQISHDGKLYVLGAGTADVNGEYMGINAPSGDPHEYMWFRESPNTGFKYVIQQVSDRCGFKNGKSWQITKFMGGIGHGGLFSVVYESAVGGLTPPLDSWDLSLADHDGEKPCPHITTSCRITVAANIGGGEYELVPKSSPMVFKSVKPGFMIRRYGADRWAIENQKIGKVYQSKPFEFDVPPFSFGMWDACGRGTGPAEIFVGICAANRELMEEHKRGEEEMKKRKQKLDIIYAEEKKKRDKMKADEMAGIKALVDKYQKEIEEAKIKAEEERQRMLKLLAEAKARADELAKKAAEEKAKADRERTEAARKAAEEARRIAQEAERQRLLDEEEKRKNPGAWAKKLAARKKAAEEARKKAEELERKFAEGTILDEPTDPSLDPLTYLIEDGKKRQVMSCMFRTLHDPMHRSPIGALNSALKLNDFYLILVPCMVQGLLDEIIFHCNQIPHVTKEVHQKAVEQLMKDKKLFYDAEFPPDSRSLGRERVINGTRQRESLGGRQVAWRRPHADRDGGFRRELPVAVFVNGEEADDVNQGSLGDCWFVSALATVAEKKGFVPRMFFDGEESKTGMYAVNITQRGIRRTVVIDDYIPCRPYGGPVFITSKCQAELWSTLVEKAYAKLRGGYMNLKGGIAHHALRDITGYPAAIVPVRSDRSPRKSVLWNQLLRLTKLGLPMCSGTYGSKYEWKDNGAINSVYGAEQAIGIYPGHAYSFLGAKEGTVNGRLVKLVNLRNPHGSFEYRLAWGEGSPSWTAEAKRVFQPKFGGDDGEFWMEYSMWTKLYQTVSFAMTSSLNGKPWAAQQRWEMQTSKYTFWNSATIELKSSCEVVAMMTQATTKNPLNPKKALLNVLITNAQTGQTVGGNTEFMLSRQQNQCIVATHENELPPGKYNVIAHGIAYPTSATLKGLGPGLDGEYKMPEDAFNRLERVASPGNFPNIGCNDFGSWKLVGADRYTKATASERFSGSPATVGWTGVRGKVPLTWTTPPARVRKIGIVILATDPDAIITRSNHLSKNQIHQIFNKAIRQNIAVDPAWKLASTHGQWG